MAETIFAGKEVEEFSLSNGLRTATDFLTIFPGFAKDLLVRDCPCDAGNGNCNQEKIYYLR
ncbi:hypothetical protein SAMN05421679_10455 [Epilithonimonas pallida]|uniref:Uncharacterized protein n=1 Tax=Epilithonimonas pallida TaxID=373671 RepID=A0ABY1R461_9FLAO|nr:hypothetical protein SAMN05421679_10455 [Epilithonimonas pallida]